jgi:hypothetical protein
MELSRALQLPIGAARDLKRRVGRAVRRLQDGARLALPSENAFLGDLGGRFGTFEEFLAAAGHDASSRLLLGDLRREFAATYFASRHPERRARVIARADRVLAHRFDLLGSGDRDLGPRIPWHADFKAGHLWEPGAHFEDLRARLEGDFGRGFDVKVPWELSRFQHLPALGQALWLTGDGRYYAEFRAELLDWIAGNRPGRGVNWTCAMDVAIRAVNWIWAYALFRPEILADRPLASLLFRSLFVHGRFIVLNLEAGSGPNGNHYFADLVGLLFLGLLFRGAPEADSWRGLAITEIARENERQTGPDGVDYEASTSYHRLMTEMALTSLLLLERAGFRLPALRHRVHGMLGYVAHYTKPDGLAPQVGDNDDGRLQILGDYDADRRDHRHLLALGGCAFDDGALFALAGGRWEEAFWFFGEDCARRLESSAAPRVSVTGRHFKDSGAVLLRHDDLYAFFETGPVGLGGLGTHAHNDTLAVEIQALGEDLLVDPGTGGYTPDLPLRDRFRSTAAHNTVRVDGEEINPLPGRPFELPGIDRPEVVRFESRAGFDLAEALHHGYARLPDPVVHRRIVLLNKRTRRFVIEDRLEGQGRHRIEWFFHLGPRCVLADRSLGCPSRFRSGGVEFGLLPVSLPEGARGYLEDDLFSPGYGRVERARVVRYEWTGDLPAIGRFAIEPGPPSGDPARTLREESQ